MPRLSLTPISAVRNGSAVLTQTALVAADDAQFTVPDGEKCVLILVGHATNPAAVSLTAGTGQQSWLSGAGDLSFTLAAATTRVVGPFDSARFENADATIFLNTDQAITAAVVALP